MRMRRIALDGRWARTVAIAGALAATGCNSEPTSYSGETTAEPETSAAETAQYETQRACITNALNSTLYKPQSDSELESALFAQDLTGCPNDFLESYVALRNAARNYLRLGKELLAHRGREEDAFADDGFNFLCSIIAGAQCTDWKTGKWEDQNADLARQIGESKAALDSAKENAEAVIARYGLYLRAPEPTPTSTTLPLVVTP